MRPVPTIIALVATAVVASGATAAAFLVSSWSTPPRPDLLRNLPSAGWQAHDEALRRRILGIVPVGSPETELIQLLAAQGFRRAWQPSSAAEHEADYDDRFRNPSLICGSMTRIWWTLDGAGRILSIRTASQDDGCP